MGNVLLDNSRDSVLSLNLEFICTKLRAPEEFKDMISAAKPDHMGLGDFFLISALNQTLMALIMAGRYQDCQATLEAVFGTVGRNVASSYDCSTGARK